MVNKTDDHIADDLYGLLLIGGRSTRMKTDKAALRFHGKEQAVYAYELLRLVCPKAYISTRKGQNLSEGQKDLPQIHDEVPFESIGPLGGIASAMCKFPEVSWLVLAVDLPFVDKHVLTYLLARRDTTKAATAYRSAYDDLPEPLCAIWEKGAFANITASVENGILCPRKFLVNSHIALINQPHAHALDNINDPKELEKVMHAIKNH